MIQTQTSDKMREVDKRESQIPFLDFFAEFVEELQLISNPESKAVYAHIKAQHKTFSFAAL